MKFRTENRTRQVDVTIDGVTHTVDEEYAEHIPVLPRSWDDIATKVAFGLVGVLTLIAVIWSTVSIGSLLNGGVGFLAALLFDISWTICLILEWKARFDPHKRAFPRNLGWVLMAVTMVFIAWHGFTLGSVALGVVGASVSAVAKVLWHAIMKYINRTLSPAHTQWVAATLSEANARLAIADAQRQVALMEDRLYAQRLAIELGRRVEGVVLPVIDSTATLAASTNEHAASTGEHAVSMIDSTAVQPGAPSKVLDARSFLTGHGTPEHSVEQVLAAIEQSVGPAALCRALAAAQLSTAASMLQARRIIRPDVNEGSFKIAMRRHFNAMASEQ